MASSTGRRGSVRQEANGTWSFVVDTTDPMGSVARLDDADSRAGAQPRRSSRAC